MPRVKKPRTRWNPVFVHSPTPQAMAVQPQVQVTECPCSHCKSERGKERVLQASDDREAAGVDLTTEQDWAQPREETFG
ncbi:hypothetical protein D9C73_010627 [Collichthys lucidus]|nr:hypothetical protein D9C73_010619 [Collichthys lucidus]TKS76538.1 hypothetical protein D9C73_010627 [Collichthys lucidus]